MMMAFPVVWPSGMVPVEQKVPLKVVTARGTVMPPVGAGAVAARAMSRGWRTPSGLVVLLTV